MFLCLGKGHIWIRRNVDSFQIHLLFTVVIRGGCRVRNVTGRDCRVRELHDLIPGMNRDGRRHLDSPTGARDESHRPRSRRSAKPQWMSCRLGRYCPLRSRSPQATLGESRHSNESEPGDEDYQSERTSDGEDRSVPLQRQLLLQGHQHEAPRELDHRTKNQCLSRDHESTTGCCRDPATGDCKHPDRVRNCDYAQEPSGRDPIRHRYVGGKAEVLPPEHAEEIEHYVRDQEANEYGAETQRSRAPPSGRMRSHTPILPHSASPGNGKMRTGY